MRTALLYLLIFSYSSIVLKPAFPSIADTVAHIFWYSAHMATIHYENGNYHVHYEYAQAAKNNTHEKDSSLLKASPDSDHITNTYSFCFTILPVTRTEFFSSPASFSCTTPDIIYHPPRV